MHMQIVQTAIPDVLIIEPKVFGDDRGFFYESFNAKRFAELTGVNAQFVQDNHSKSAKMYYAACIIKLNNHKANLCVWLLAKCLITDCP